jgi:uncharacterized membrane protein
MNTKSLSKVQRLAGVAILAAIVVVLQTVASGIHIGPFTITLALVPIIIGGVMYGPGAGAFLGAVFGLVVTIAVLTGADPGGNVMLGINPFMTVLICIGKSTVAGLVSGFIAAKVCPKNLTLGIVLASIAAPVCNTGIFSLGLYFFFYDLLLQWAGGSNAVGFIVTTLIGMNFLLELLIDIVLAPVIIQIIRAVHSGSSR